MSPRFEAPCPDCLEPIEYVAYRPATHDCVTDDGGGYVDDSNGD